MLLYETTINQSPFLSKKQLEPGFCGRSQCRSIRGWCRFDHLELDSGSLCPKLREPEDRELQDGALRWTLRKELGGRWFGESPYTEGVPRSSVVTVGCL
ncbi:hypothetical protein FEM48_Zijuj09G0143900 [Ziziphus jujuba var. spinosa]|uniref:Uncharacterized protein n=1 Tax=Ziziphus jujuba var. spinosa TaxID=714518 RepID=A0A978UTH6_ZIZJJ|nr:hypothetical protein FEM48_Zijuj09G0143900 [Ziziphus jujuba var. spinosa]